MTNKVQTSDRQVDLCYVLLISPTVPRIPVHASQFCLRLRVFRRTRGLLLSVVRDDDVAHEPHDLRGEVS